MQSKLKFSTIIEYSFSQCKKYFKELTIFFLVVACFDFFLTWLLKMSTKLFFAGFWPEKRIYLFLIILLGLCYFLFYSFIFFNLFRLCTSPSSIISYIRNFSYKNFLKYLKGMLYFIFIIATTLALTFIILAIIGVLIKLMIGYLSPKFVYYAVSSMAILIFLPIIPIFSRFFYFSFFMIDQNSGALKALKESFKMTKSKTVFSSKFILFSLLPVFLSAIIIIYFELSGFHLNTYLSTIINFILSLISIPFLNFGTFYIYQSYKINEESSNVRRTQTVDI